MIDGPKDIPQAGPPLAMKVIATEPPKQYLGVLSIPPEHPDLSVIMLDYDNGLDTRQLKKLQDDWGYLLMKTSPEHFNLIITHPLEPQDIWPWIVNNAPDGYSIAYLGRSYRPYEDEETQAPCFCVRITAKNGHTPKMIAHHPSPAAWVELISVLAGEPDLDKILGTRYGKPTFVQYSRARSLMLWGGVLGDDTIGFKEQLQDKQV